MKEGVVVGYIATIGIVTFIAGWWSADRKDGELLSHSGDGKNQLTADSTQANETSGPLSLEFREWFGDGVLSTDQHSMAEQWHRIGAIDSPLKRQTFESAWLAGAIKRDPLGTLKFLREHEGIEGAKLAVQLWATQDPAACAAALPSSGDDWAALAVEALPALVEQDAAIAVSVLKQLPDNVEPAGMEMLASKNLELAHEVLASLRGETLGRAQDAVARAWTQQDPEAALAWAKEIGSGNFGQSAVRNVIVEWAKIDPFVAAEHIELNSRLGVGQRGNGKVPEEAVLAGMLKIDPAKAIDWFWDNKVSPYFLPYAIRSAVGNDVSAAMALVAQVPAGSARSIVLGELKGGLVEGYGDAIGDWLKTDLDLDSDFISDVRRLHFNSMDREQTLALLNEIPEDEAKKLLIKRTRRLGGAFHGTVSDMTTYIHALPEDIRGDALETVISDLYFPNFGPAGYAQLLDDFPPGEKRIEAVAITAGMWAGQPSAAIPWLESLTDPIEQQKGYGAFAEKWAKADPYATSEWIAELPEGPPRDASAKNLVGEIVKSDPNSAFEWAQFISLEEDRVEAIGMAYNAWRAVDAEAADAALNELPGSDKAGVNSTLNRSAEADWR